MNVTNITKDASNVSQQDGEAEMCGVCKDVKSLEQQLFIIQLIFPTITLAANALTCIAIYRASGMKASLRLSLLNLSVTDISASLIYIYHIAFAWTHFEVNPECIARYVAFVATHVLTLSTVNFMSVDRFLSLFTPYVYERLANTRYVQIAITVTWIITTLVVGVGFSFVRLDAEGCFYPLLFRSFTHYYFAVSAWTAMTFTIILNVIIFIFTRRQISKIATTLVGEAREQHITRMGLKSAITTVVIVTPFFLLHSPMYALMVYFAADEAFTKTSDALWTINALSSVALVNSLTNPAIYIWRLEPVRVQLKKMLKPLTCLFPSSSDDRTRSSRVQTVVTHPGRRSNPSNPDTGTDEF